MITTPTLPGSDAARHGTGDVDLGIMIAAHNAFRRDLVKLARTASRRNLADPVSRLAIGNGWDVFKRQLLQHHRAEDACLWPPLRTRLAGSPAAMSTLDAMEEEHGLIDPLLAAVDHALADREATDRQLGDVIDELTGKLTHHLAHEERDTLRLIGVTLTTGEWSAVLGDIRARGSAADAMEMVPWLLDKLPPEAIAELLSSFPPAAGQRYQDWKRSYDAKPRW
jgi:iron-sulfur cluster repair protein YtfE (RIC family)